MIFVSCLFSLVDSSLGDYQLEGPGGHQDQRGLGPRVAESCPGKQVRVVFVLTSCWRFFKRSDSGSIFTAD